MKAMESVRERFQHIASSLARIIQCTALILASSSLAEPWPEKVNFAWPLNRYRDYVGEAYGEYNATTTIMPVHCRASSGDPAEPLSLRFSTGMKLLRACPLPFVNNVDRTGR